MSVEIKRVQSSRRRYRAHLKKLLQNADGLLEKLQPLDDVTIATLRDLHEQLQRKHDAVSALDVKIIEAIENNEELGTHKINPVY